MHGFIQWSNLNLARHSGRPLCSFRSYLSREGTAHGRVAIETGSRDTRDDGLTTGATKRLDPRTGGHGSLLARVGFGGVDQALDGELRFADHKNGAADHGDYSGCAAHPRDFG